MGRYKIFVSEGSVKLTQTIPITPSLGPRFLNPISSVIPRVISSLVD